MKLHEIILVCIAGLLCAVVLSYNAFISPDLTAPVIIYNSDFVSSEESEASESSHGISSVEGNSSIDETLHSSEDLVSNETSYDGEISSGSETSHDDRSAHSDISSKEDRQTESSENSQAAKPKVININTANADELDELPGVGPVIAQRIIEYREAMGGFKSLEELIEVKGIGEKTMEKIRPFACVD